MDGVLEPPRLGDGKGLGRGSTGTANIAFSRPVTASETVRFPAVLPATELRSGVASPVAAEVLFLFVAVSYSNFVTMGDVPSMEGSLNTREPACAKPL